MPFFRQIFQMLEYTSENKKKIKKVKRGENAMVKSTNAGIQTR